MTLLIQDASLPSIFRAIIWLAFGYHSLTTSFNMWTQMTFSSGESYLSSVALQGWIVAISVVLWTSLTLTGWTVPIQHENIFAFSIIFNHEMAQIKTRTLLSCTANTMADDALAKLSRRQGISGHNIDKNIPGTIQWQLKSLHNLQKIIIIYWCWVNK